MGSFVSFMNDILYKPYVVPLLLIAVGIYFTVRTKGVQFRLFKEMFRVIMEKPENDEGVSSFGALMVSTASRVGTGNIIGVCTAIVLGGPGAIFWMWITALLGGANAFIESTLAQIYKKKSDDGTYYGGPSYYMQNALGQRWLGVIFAILVIFTYAVGYNMLAAFNLQSTFAAFSFYNEASTPKVIGVILAVLFGIIVLGGAKKLIKVTEFLVPIMGVIYVIMAVVVLVLNIKNLGAMFGLIFSSAFNFKAIFGGFAGSCIMWGLKRGLYSNEAGMGSTPHAHALAKNTTPHQQGTIAMFGVFFDTFIVLTLNALVVISTMYTPDGVLHNGYFGNITHILSNTNLVQTAFGSVFGISFGKIFVAICLMFFAFSTILSWNLFGKINMLYLFGKKHPKVAATVYTIISLTFIMLGTLSSSNLVWELTDMFNNLMVIPNVIALFALTGLVLANMEKPEQQ